MMRRSSNLGVVGLVGLLLAGCTGGKPTQFKNEPHDHSHDRTDAMLEDIELMSGKYHAGLTAHLSKEPGQHELDVFFETMENPPKAVPIPLTAKVTARVTRAGDDQAYTLEFKPTEKAERPTDPEGKCSRFSAEAPWMKPEDKLDVVLTVVIDGQAKKCTFIGFVPKEKSHHHD
jgi:hypothetical protein